MYIQYIPFCSFLFISIQFYSFLFIPKHLNWQFESRWEISFCSSTWWPHDWGARWDNDDPSLSSAKTTPAKSIQHDSNNLEISEKIGSWTKTNSNVSSSFPQSTVCTLPIWMECALWNERTVAGFVRHGPCCRSLCTQDLGRDDGSLKSHSFIKSHNFGSNNFFAKHDLLEARGYQIFQSFANHCLMTS